MAIYNPILNEIAAGRGISTIQNASGAVVISTIAIPPTVKVAANAVVTFADSAGDLQGSGVSIDSTNNMSGISTLSCNTVALNSSTHSISLSAPSGLSASATYTMPSSMGMAGNLLILNSVVDSVGSLTWTAAAGEGLITGVNGTTNRITSSGGVTPALDIAATYIGQSSITTLGTITSGYWNAYTIQSNFGGTGVNNNGNTLTVAGNFSTTGAYTANLNVTGNTNVTLPTTGTLATVAQIPAFPLSVSNGGTGQSSLTTNALLIGNGTGTINFLAGGTAGYALTSAGTTSIPAWTSLSGYAPLNSPIFTDGIFFNSETVPGWNIGASSSTNPSAASFGISNNYVVNALRIDGYGNVVLALNLTVDGSITNYSTTTQMNSAISSALSSYVTSTSLSSTLNNYTTNASLASTLGNYLTTSVAASTYAPIGSYVTSSSLTTTLSNYTTNSSLSSTLSNYATNSTLTNYAPLNNPIFTGGIFFNSTVAPGWNIGITASTTQSTAKFSISNNYVVQVLGIDGYGNAVLAGNLTVDGSIANYSTTSQVNSSISSALSSYVTNSTLSSTLGNYVTNSSLSGTLGNYVTNSTLSAYVAPNKYSTNYLMFVASTDFSDNIYFMSPTIGSYYVDMSSVGGAGPNLVMPPDSSLTNLQQFYIQTSPGGIYNIGIYGGSGNDWFFTSYGTGQSSEIGLSPNTTYQFTYYQKSIQNNPWDSTGIAPGNSFTATVWQNTGIPIPNNTSFLGVYTKAKALTCNLAVPTSLTEGTYFSVADMNSHGSQSQVIINQINGNSIDGATSLTMNNNNFRVHMVYSGSGSYGKLTILSQQ